MSPRFYNVRMHTVPREEEDEEEEDMEEGGTEVAAECKVDEQVRESDEMG